MKVGIQRGGDGVLCWNGEAIRAYAAGVDQREQAVSAANPDVEVLPGTVTCHGCVALEYDNGAQCTAELHRTLYRVRGEVGPRPADAAAPLREVPGLRSRIDLDVV